MKAESNKVIISSIVCHADNFKETLYHIHIIYIILYYIILYYIYIILYPKRHLNKSRLGLNDAVISVLVRNFKAFLTNSD